MQCHLKFLEASRKKYDAIRCWTPSKIHWFFSFYIEVFKSLVDKEVNIGHRPVVGSCQHPRTWAVSKKKYDAISSGIHERLILSLSTCSKLHRIAPNSLLASLARVFASNSLLASLARVFASTCIIPKSSKKRVRPPLCTSLVPHLRYMRYKHKCTSLLRYKFHKLFLFHFFTHIYPP